MSKADKESVTVDEGKDVELVCTLLYGAENEQQDVEWQWFDQNDAPIEETDLILIENNNDNNKLLFRSVNMTQKGNYKCKATNSFGSAEKIIRLRIKSIRELFLLDFYYIFSFLKIYS